MKTYKLKTYHRKLLADTTTPVNVYLKLRDIFPNSILLESSDYRGNENSFSYICCKPIARFEVINDTIIKQFPDTNRIEEPIGVGVNIPTEIVGFIKSFKSDKNEFNFISNGLFGYICYDAVRYFQGIKINNKRQDSLLIPDMVYCLYQYVIALNHFKDELYIFEHKVEGANNQSLTDGVNYIADLINNRNIAAFCFNTSGDESSDISDEKFLEMLKQAKLHISRGDVFQIVLSRRFSQHFTGDEFNVYRSLRSINPSPYLFYFDYGNFKILGSSPEAQVVIKNKKVNIYPIAGTFKRTGNDHEDAELAERLKKDPKENAEHAMLVDLARNDLSRSGRKVSVNTFSDIQFYSHVIHLVSHVSAELQNGISEVGLIADTFPAGTLSGAPKYRAMQLIEQYEPVNRSFYGGCVGFMNFDGNINMAIMIRSFLSKDNTLYYQAGAGIVAESDADNELQEVNNKLLALKDAMEMAKRL